MNVKGSRCAIASEERGGIFFFSELCRKRRLLRISSGSDLVKKVCFKRVTHGKCAFFNEFKKIYSQYIGNYISHVSVKTNHLSIIFNISRDMPSTVLTNVNL